VIRLPLFDWLDDWAESLQATLFEVVIVVVGAFTVEQPAAANPAA
jgi:hypothetical protein